MIQISQLTSSSCLYQVTIYTKRTKCHPHPPPEALHAWTHMITNVLFQRYHGGFKRLTGIKNALAKCLFTCKSQLNTLVFLSVLKDKKNLKDRGQENVGAVTKKRSVLRRHILYDLFFLFFGETDY
jgi:hypothetical protein